MSNLFFTSDHHFGHDNIIRFCNRPFADVREMNEALIERWNEKVKKNDVVYHLGDFALMYKENLETILKQLKGKIHLIEGNHEGAALQCRKYFESIRQYHELKVKDPDCKNGVQRIILFHYAMRTWRGEMRGNWHLYGHSHGNLPDLPDRQCFDIGVDSHDFYPLEYEEVKAIMQKKEWTPSNQRAEP